MIYQKERTLILLHEEDYREYKIVIINHGTHPCGYIGTKKINNMLFNKSYEELSKIGYEEDVHYGFTYSGFGIANFYSNYWFIVWDYAHCGDYRGDYIGYDYIDQSGNKKWTTEEILEEARKEVEKMEKTKLKEIVIKKLVIDNEN